MSPSFLPVKDDPWLMRTYSGHSSAARSNELYRTNLAQGQTGLSVAFDLPTQTGYDPDHPLARGEVGKVGVPVAHIEDLDALFAGLPLDRMNTAMTINATAAWLMALYVALAQRRGIDPKNLRGTTQNDIVKEYLSRGTYVFPPEPSMRLTVDTVTWSYRHAPKWNPTNISSYHLQEAGATPVQEIAYALATATELLDRVRASGQVPEADFPQVVGRISFFVNAGIRFVEEMCKLRAFTEMWDRITAERYGVVDEALRRFRYGVQVNSLGLTENQPENNVQRIVLEMLGVTLSKSARARAIQLPAWNEALGLPRPWDQQWSLRIQQVLALESDLLEYADLFDGSPVIEAKVRELVEGAQTEIENVRKEGGAIAAVESGYMKRGLVASHVARLRAIERGDLAIVGVNRFVESAESPLTVGADGGILRVDPAVEREQVEAVRAFRSRRNREEVESAIRALKDAAVSGTNIVPPSIRAARAGVTTGEWGQALREVFGEYRPPAGIDAKSTARGREEIVAELHERVRRTTRETGETLRVLVGKPGLDGHSNGAEQIAIKCRDAGMEVIYEGIRLTPEQIVTSAMEEGVHLVGLSILSGSHMELIPAIKRGLEAEGLGDVPVVVGGIIPETDARLLVAEGGIASVYTPKDTDLNRIVADMIDVVRRAKGLAPFGKLPEE